MTLTIRPARTSELAIVAGLWTEAAAWLASRGIDQWQYPPHLDRIEASITAGECWVGIGNRSGHPVATITLDERADPDFWTAADEPADALYAHRMALARAAAGQGLGAEMLDWAAARAAAAGKRWLRLDAWRDNPGLRRYYERHGFTHIRTVVIGHRRSGVLMQRPTAGGTHGGI
jgi:GNAT superfamily N-acetyltransferase